MGKKLLTLIGIGAGYMLVRKQLRENPDGAAAKVIHYVKENPAVKRASDVVVEKSSEFVRKQGEVITDKVAESIKERLFGVPAQPQQADAVGSEQGEVESEDTKTM